MLQKDMNRAMYKMENDFNIGGKKGRGGEEGAGVVVEKANNQGAKP